MSSGRRGPGGLAAPGKDDEGPLEVEVDARLTSLFPAFVARRWRDVERLLEDAERSNFQAIAELGHNLKGTGSGYGVDAISEIGAELEQAAAERDAAAVRALADRMAALLGRLRPVFR